MRRAEGIMRTQEDSTPMGERLAGKIAIVTGAGSRGPGMGNGKAAAILMAREAVGRWGALDILHNNVGIESRQTRMDTTAHEWDRVMAVDLKSMLLATQAAVPASSAAAVALSRASRRWRRCAGPGATPTPRPRRG